jgi:Homeodomain-like domain-containing protein
MPRGRTTSFTIRLTPEERRTLLAWQRLTSIPAGLARRGRIIILLADGMTITDIAATVGLSRRHTYKWIQPTFKGVWYAAVNFALLPLRDTRPDQCLRPRR